MLLPAYLYFPTPSHLILMLTVRGTWVSLALLSYCKEPFPLWVPFSGGQVGNLDSILASSNKVVIPKDSNNRSLSKILRVSL